jgi:hypothetical protein
MKNRLIYGYFKVEVHERWEWFLTTILDGRPAKFIAVTNRAHNFFRRYSDTKNFPLRSNSNWPLPAKGAAYT